MEGYIGEYVDYVHWVHVRKPSRGYGMTRYHFPVLHTSIGMNYMQGLVNYLITEVGAEQHWVRLLDTCKDLQDCVLWRSMQYVNFLDFHLGANIWCHVA